MRHTVVRLVIILRALCGLCAEDLCVLVRQKEFCGLIIFDRDASEEIAIRTVACDDCLRND